jgi:ABC-2 type transport system permease protein
MWAMLKLKIRLMKDNRILYIIMLGMGLLLAAVFGDVFASGDYLPSVAWVNEAGVIEDSELAYRIGETGDFAVVPMDLPSAYEAVENGDVIAAVNRTGTGLELIALRESLEVMQLQRALEAQQLQSASVEKLKAAVMTVLEVGSESSETMDQAAVERAVQFEAVSTWDYDEDIHYTLGMTLFFVTYSVLFTVGDLLEDKRLGTMNRMLVSPVSRVSILVANLIAALTIGVLQVGIMFIAGKFLFGIAFGSQLPLMLVIAVIYLFTITALSLFVVSIVRNMSQLGALSPIVLTGMGMLGGCMWPLEIIDSKALLFLADLTPHHWALSSIERLSIHGVPDSSTWFAIGVLFLMGIVYLVLGERVLYLKSLHQN